MNKIKNLKLNRSIEKHLSKGFALMSSGFVGAGVVLGALDYPVILPFAVASLLAVESAFTYMQSLLTDVQITCNEYLEKAEEERQKVLIKN